LYVAFFWHGIIPVPVFQNECQLALPGAASNPAAFQPC
jgi:hypothetical protein